MLKARRAFQCAIAGSGGIERIGAVAVAAISGDTRGEAVVLRERFAFVALALAVALLSGCATTQVQTVTAAERLEWRADAFASRFCHEPGATCRANRYAPAARRLADQARLFRKVVESDGDPQVVLSYKRLWRKYHALRDEVCRLHDRRLRVSLRPTAQAFAYVQILVENGYSYADPTLYAMGGFTLDPYYN